MVSRRMSLRVHELYVLAKFFRWHPTCVCGYSGYEDESRRTLLADVRGAKFYATYWVCGHCGRDMGTQIWCPQLMFSEAPTTHYFMEAYRRWEKRYLRRHRDELGDVVVS